MIKLPCLLGEASSLSKQANQLHKGKAKQLEPAACSCINAWATHVAGMRGKLPDVVKLPPSVTVPFSSFEEALKQRENKDMAKRLEAAVKNIPQTNAEEKLRECRDIVMEVSNPWQSCVNI